MQTWFRWVGAIVCCLAGCGDGQEGPKTPGGTGGAGGAGISIGCPPSYTLCGTACCTPGKVCGASGSCEYPYKTAELHVYLCPSFNSGNCTATFFSIDQTCTPLRSPVPGSCYNTGFEVAAGQSYGISSCVDCGNGCGNPSSVTTPPGFSKPNYYSGMTFYCGTPCTAPSDCSHEANAVAPDGG